MRIAQLAEPVSMNVRLRQYPKVISIRLTRIYVPIVVPAPTYALLRQFIPQIKPHSVQENRKLSERAASFFLTRIVPGASK